MGVLNYRKASTIAVESCASDHQLVSSAAWGDYICRPEAQTSDILGNSVPT